jgi:uncharacterized membrane protein (DUF2068 family)
MEDNQPQEMSQQDSNPGTAPVKSRPTFLTVLCILTFIGSGWGIIDSFTDYLAADTAEDAVGLVEGALDDAMDEMEDEDLSEEQMDFVQNLLGGMTENLTAANIRKISIVNLVSCILTLLGAIMMWRLRKNGYYIYIVGFLIFIVGPALILGGIMGAMYAGATGFLGVVFAVLYGVNLKHLS